MLKVGLWLYSKRCSVGSQCRILSMWLLSLNRFWRSIVLTWVRPEGEKYLEKFEFNIILISSFNLISSHLNFRMNLIVFVILNVPRYAGALRASGEMASAQYITAGQYVYWEGLSYSINVTNVCVYVCVHVHVWRSGAAFVSGFFSWTMWVLGELNSC